MASGATINDLPDELILLVLRQLDSIPSHEPQSTAFVQKEKERRRQCENALRTQTLNAICLASHRLRAIATPILYASFASVATRNGMSKLELFHRTITSPFRDQGPRALHADFIQSIENRLSDHLGNSLSDNADADEAPQMIARYYSLLSDVAKHAPNLRHLNVVSIETTDVSFWTHLLPETASSTPCSATMSTNQRFARLQNLYFQIHSAATGPGSPLFRGICAALSTASCLTNFHASGVPVSHWEVPLAHKFTDLQRLELTQCMLEFSEVGELWFSCDGLRHIGCEWTHMDCDNERPSDLYRGLLRHVDTLETLRLDARDVSFYQRGYDESTHLGNLQQFTKLLALTACEHTLFGALRQYSPGSRKNLFEARLASLLPSGLEAFLLLLSLSCTEVELYIALDIGQLAQNLKGCYEALSEITVHYGAKGHITAPAVMQAFETAGIRCNIVNTD